MSLSTSMFAKYWLYISSPSLMTRTLSGLSSNVITSLTVILLHLLISFSVCSL
ncbi:hypothetical protein 2019_scaffold132_00020 [Bacteriophage sp.]|nr:hypothetical protein 2019_scaffold132_00020 [Bacteriophage sp.]